MKNLLTTLSVTLLVILFIGCTKTETLTGPRLQPLTQIINNNLRPGISLTALRNTKVSIDSIYTTLENGDNGVWAYDPLDTNSKDNIGTIIVTSDGKTLKRILSATDAIYASWFGLKGDGSDETTILQAAINASAGRTLILPTGTFFAKKINLVSNFNLTGNNSKLRNIQGDNTDNIFVSLWTLTNVEIYNIEIALNGIRGDIWAGTSAIQMQNCSNIHIHDCFIHDNTYVGIRLTGGNTHIKVNNNFIENTDTGVHANNDNSDLNIISNIISKGTSEGITIYGYNEQNIPFNFHIDSNIIQHKENSFGINISYAKMGSITHNTITNCLGGITLHDVVSVGKEGYYTTDMIIKNNAIKNSDFGIINIGDRTVVSDNRLENIQQDGINANNYPDDKIITKNVIISNNTIISPALAGGGRGGISVRNLANSSIDHNTITKCGNAFSLRFNGLCENLIISQNNFLDGTLQSTNTIYDNTILIANNIIYKTYFPMAYPINNEVKLNVSGNIYTTDTTYNTAPDYNGVYSDINTFNIRSSYSLSAGTVKKIVPSWIGRIIKLKSTNSFLLVQGNNINLRDGVNISVSNNNNVLLKYDGNNWNEISRTF